jgi:hypothetical protein
LATLRENDCDIKVGVGALRSAASGPPPQRVNLHRQAAAEIRSPQDVGNQAEAEGVSVQPHIDQLPIANDGVDASEEIHDRQGRVGMIDRVALGDDLPVLSPGGTSDQTVGEEPVVTCEHDDLTPLHILARGRRHQQNIARPQGRDHAASRDLESHLMTSAQRLNNQLAANSIERTPPRFRSGVGRYEFLRLDLHWPCVVLIFPHASAIVSKVCSKRNDGFT